MSNNPPPSTISNFLVLSQKDKVFVVEFQPLYYNYSFNKANTVLINLFATDYTTPKEKHKDAMNAGGVTTSMQFKLQTFPDRINGYSNQFAEFLSDNEIVSTTPPAFNLLDPIQRMINRTKELIAAGNLNENQLRKARAQLEQMKGNAAIIGRDPTNKVYQKMFTAKIDGTMLIRATLKVVGPYAEYPSYGINSMKFITVDQARDPILWINNWNKFGYAIDVQRNYLTEQVAGPVDIANMSFVEDDDEESVELERAFLHISTFYPTTYEEMSPNLNVMLSFVTNHQQEMIVIKNDQLREFFDNTKPWSRSQWSKITKLNQCVSLVRHPQEDAAWMLTDMEDIFSAAV
ncbi:hypothetical protein Cantr_02219 [Candida viswanathii]|uniref:Uncharacterized protein n=1 Tax=Candida viswanathii TaxID=5486 RepID=A0A367YL56_9ASCO|nr:hypothetical protein Cantr_02219 [Candida viswanathii]